MKDRELLELAARAAGIKGNWGESLYVGDDPVDLTDLFFLAEGEYFWNPLTDDGDALRLAATLKFCVDTDSAGEVVIWGSGPAGRLMHVVSLADDPMRAVRHAIVRAAALVGAQAQYAEQIEAGIAAADAGQLTDIDLVKNRWLERRLAIKVDATKS